MFRRLFWIFSAVSTIPVELMVMVKRKANNRQERKGEEVMFSSKCYFAGT